MKYTFLCYNVGGDFESIAMRLMDEGYDVYYYKKKGMEKGREDTGVGIIPKRFFTDDPWEVLNKVPKEELIILIDDNGYGDMADFLKNLGYMVIGGSAFADKIEYERSLGTRMMEKIGLKVPPTHNFEKIDDGIEFLMSRGDDEKFVFKPEGEEFAGSAKTYTGKNKKDLVGYLRWIKENSLEQHYTIAKFELQEFIDGFEADFSAYFDGEKFMEGSTCVDIEEKKSQDGNKGAAIGCAGNVVYFVKSSKYYDNYIKKLENILKKVGYTGQISINNIFSSKDGQPYALEFTSRCGWDAHVTEMAIHKFSGQKISDFYIALATKSKFKFNHNTVGCGIRIYSGSIDLQKCDVAGRYMSFEKDVKDFIWPYAISYKNGSYVVEDNPVMVVNGVDKKMNKAIELSYEYAKKVNVPDIAYRMEIGQRAGEVTRFLIDKGWI